MQPYLTSCNFATLVFTHNGTLDCVQIVEICYKNNRCVQIVNRKFRDTFSRKGNTIAKIFRKNKYTSTLGHQYCCK